VTLDDLTVNFKHLDRECLLSDWRWLTGPQRLPIPLTASGDAFLQDKNDSSIYVLDVATAEFKRVADTPAEFQALLADRTFVMNRFAVAMIADLRRSGRVLAPGQIYSFKKPPVLGGEYVLENIEATDIGVHFSIAGQIHERVRKLPPGTKISGLKTG
jgi:type VI secretion system (T6SS) immunity protein Tdi1